MTARPQIHERMNDGAFFEIEVKFEIVRKKFFAALANNNKLTASEWGTGTLI